MHSNTSIHTHIIHRCQGCSTTQVATHIRCALHMHVDIDTVGSNSNRVRSTTTRSATKSLVVHNLIHSKRLPDVTSTTRDSHLAHLLFLRSSCPVPRPKYSSRARLRVCPLDAQQCAFNRVSRPPTRSAQPHNARAARRRVHFVKPPVPVQAPPAACSCGCCCRPIFGSTFGRAAPTRESRVPSRAAPSCCHARRRRC